MADGRMSSMARGAVDAAIGWVEDISEFQTEYWAERFARMRGRSILLSGRGPVKSMFTSLRLSQVVPSSVCII